MKKIFIIGTITSKIPQEFKEIEENLKKDFSNQVISTYDEHSQGNEKMNWVFNNIENSSLIVALFPQISFGTSFELGYSIAKDKNILLITLEDVYEKIKEHPVMYLENISLVSYKNYEEVKKQIENFN